jgi:predicted nuclease with TOPRIM domain
MKKCPECGIDRLEGELHHTKRMLRRSEREVARLQSLRVKYRDMVKGYRECNENLEQRILLIEDAVICRLN